MPRWEPRAGAMALRTARSSCAPGNASLGGGPAGVGKVCEKRGPTCGSKMYPTQLEMIRAAVSFEKDERSQRLRIFFFLTSFVPISYPLSLFFTCLTPRGSPASPSLFEIQAQFELLSSRRPWIRSPLMDEKGTRWLAGATGEGPRHASPRVIPAP